MRPILSNVKRAVLESYQPVLVIPAMANCAAIDGIVVAQGNDGNMFAYLLATIDKGHHFNGDASEQVQHVMTALSKLDVKVCCLVFAVLDRLVSDGWQKVPDALSEVPQFHWKVGGSHVPGASGFDETVHVMVTCGTVVCS